MARQTSRVMMVILIIVALFLLSKCSTSAEGVNFIGEDTGDSAIIPYFVDKDYNAIIPESMFADEDTKKISRIVLNYTGVPAQTSNEVAFMRFDVKVRNLGIWPKSVQIQDVKILNANGTSVEPSLSVDAFNCVRNKPKVLQAAGGADSTYFNTTPGGPFGCSSLVWIPTQPFERYPQPLKLEATLYTTTTIFSNFNRSATIKKEFWLWITNDSDPYGSLAIDMFYSSNTYIDECNKSTDWQYCPGAADLTICGPAASATCACYNVRQNCTLFGGTNGTYGLWPGCVWSDYASFFTGSSEAGTNYTLYCKDGKDNDCDGMIDKPGITGTCSNCDWDCPKGIVMARTNAPVTGGTPCGAAGNMNCGPFPYSDANTWLSIRTSPSAPLQIYGLYTSVAASGQNCADAANWLPTVGSYQKIGETPGDIKLPVYWSGSPMSKVLRVYYGTATTCHYLVYQQGYGASPLPGEGSYAEAVAIVPVDRYMGKENLMDY